MTKRGAWIVLPWLLLLALGTCKTTRDIATIVWLEAFHAPPPAEAVLRSHDAPGGARYRAEVVRISKGGATMRFLYRVAVTDRQRPSSGNRRVWTSYGIQPTVSWVAEDRLCVTFSRAELLAGSYQTHRHPNVKVEVRVLER